MSLCVLVTCNNYSCAFAALANFFVMTCILILLQVRQSRDPEVAKKCLAAIEECARTREGNLLALAVEAARARSGYLTTKSLTGITNLTPA